MKVLDIEKLRLILDKVEAANQKEIYVDEMEKIYDQFGDSAYYDRDSSMIVRTKKGLDIEDVGNIYLN